MGKNSKKNLKKEVVENMEEQQTVVAPVEDTNAADLVVKAAEAKAKAEAAAKEAKAAAAEAKEAARLAKIYNGRPVRLSSFKVYATTTDAEVTKEAVCGEYMDKSDVHYVAEKSALDAIDSLRAQGKLDSMFLIYTTSKELDENGVPKKMKLVSKIYIDKETMQIVID